MQPPLLQPMRIGDLLDSAFRLYRTHFVLLITITALALVPLTIVRLLVTSLLVLPALDSLQSAFFVPLISAAVVSASACIYRDMAVTAAQAYRDGARRYLSILGATFLEGLIIALPALVIAGCLLAGLLNSSSSSLLALAMVVIVLLPFAVFIATRYAVAFPAIIIEGVGASKGMSRSWSLTKGKFWHSAGVFISATILTVLISQLPTFMVGFIAGLTGSLTAAPWLISAQLVLSQLGLMITLPFQYLVAVVLYYDLRIRSEGYDLELASQSGQIAPETGTS
jgi:hypothetical protein